MYIRVDLRNLRNLKTGEFVDNSRKESAILPASDKTVTVYGTDTYGRYRSICRKVYYNGEFYYVRANNAYSQMLWTNDKIIVKDKVYTITGGGSVFYIAQSDDGEVIRKKYFDKNGNFTFTLPKDEDTKITIEETPRFEDFKSAIKTNDKYNQDEYNQYIFKNYQRAIISKSSLIELMRKSPYWNERELCLEKNILVTSEINFDEVIRAARELFDHLELIPIYNAPMLDRLSDIRHLCLDYYSYHIDQNVLKFYKTNYKVRQLISCETQPFCDLNFDAKCSRVVMELCDKLGIERTKEFETLFAKYADTVSTKKKKYKFVVSVNPADFVTMSHGNSWKSCHSFRNNGCYHAGCLSYANDSNTVIAYLLPEDTEENYWAVNKIKRQLFFLGDNHEGIVQSKMYPDNGNNSLHQEFASEVIEMFNSCGLNIGDNVNLSAKIHTYPGSLHYPDYEYWYKGYGNCQEEFHVGALSYALNNGCINTTHGGCLTACNRKIIFESEISEKIIQTLNTDVENDDKSILKGA